VDRGAVEDNEVFAANLRRDRALGSAASVDDPAQIVPKASERRLVVNGGFSGADRSRRRHELDDLPVRRLGLLRNCNPGTIAHLDLEATIGIDLRVGSDGHRNDKRCHCKTTHDGLPGLQTSCVSEEAAEILTPPRPVMTEDASPYLEVILNSLRPENRRELAVLVDDRVVLAGGDDPVDARELADPLAVHVRNVRRGAIEIAILVPVAIELVVNVVDAGETDGAVDDVGIARGKVCGV